MRMFTLIKKITNCFSERLSQFTLPQQRSGNTTDPYSFQNRELSNIFNFAKWTQNGISCWPWFLVSDVYLPRGSPLLWNVCLAFIHIYGVDFPYWFCVSLTLGFHQLLMFHVITSELVDCLFPSFMVSFEAQNLILMQCNDQPLISCWYTGFYFSNHCQSCITV